MNAPKNSTLRLANQLITGRYDFSSSELDVMALIIRELGNENYIQISTDRLYALFGDTKERAAILKKASNGLMKKTAHILDQENGLFYAFSFVSGYTWELRKNLITYRLDPVMYEMLANLKREYTPVQLAVFLKLSSKYAKRLYLMGKQFQGTGKLVISVNELHSRLQTGDKLAYQKFGQFAREVIDVAIDDINENSDILIKRQPSKRGIITDTVFFEITSKNAPADERDEKQKLAANFLHKVGMNERQITNILSHENLAEVYAIIHKFRMIATQVQKPAPYLAKMFREAEINVDYGNNGLFTPAPGARN